MKINNEKEILFIIRYGLPVFILVVSFVITILLFQESKQNFETLKEASIYGYEACECVA